jgi:hypothetical protein
VDQQLAHPVHCLYVLLFHRFHGHEVHRWPAGGFDDNLRIVAIVLARVSACRRINR